LWEKSDETHNPLQVIVDSSTLSYFYPTLVKGLGYTAHMAQYMVRGHTLDRKANWQPHSNLITFLLTMCMQVVPIYAVAFVAVAVSGYVCDRIPQYRGLVIAAWLTLSLICSIVICVVYNFVARYVLLVLMAAGLWASNGLSLSFAASTFGSMQQETRAVSLAFVNAMGNLAQIYGSYLFPADDPPKYLLGFGVISGMCAVGVVTYAVAQVLLRRHPIKS